FSSAKPTFIFSISKLPANRRDGQPCRSPKGWPRHTLLRRGPIHQLLRWPTSRARGIRAPYMTSPLPGRENKRQRAMYFQKREFHWFAICNFPPMEKRFGSFQETICNPSQPDRNPPGYLRFACCRRKIMKARASFRYGEPWQYRELRLLWDLP